MFFYLTKSRRLADTAPALLAATMRTTQRGNARRTELKEQHMESESNKTGKIRRKTTSKEIQSRGT